MDRLKQRKTHSQYRVQRYIHHHDSRSEAYMVARLATMRGPRRPQKALAEMEDGRMRMQWPMVRAQARHFGICCTERNGSGLRDWHGRGSNGMVKSMLTTA